MSPEIETAAKLALAKDLLRQVDPAAYVAETDEDEAHQLVRVSPEFFPMRDALLEEQEREANEAPF